MIRLRTEELEPLKFYSVEHNTLVKKLENDILVLTYLSENLKAMLSQPKNEKEFEDGKTYVVNHEGNKLGVVITSKIDEKGIIDLYIALLQVYRNKGFGSKTLVQMTQFLTEEIKKVDDVRLNINKLNTKANKIAVDNGFIKTDETNNNYVYRYFN